MSATPIQKFGLTGTLVAILGTLLLVFLDIEGSGSGSFLVIPMGLFPPLIMSFLIYKFPGSNPGVKVSSFIFALPAFIIFYIYTFYEPSWGASVGVIPGLGALMWILAAFPESLKQSQNSE